MAGSVPFALTPTRRPRRPHFLLKLVAVGCVVAVLVEIGIFTSGFGLVGLLGRSSSGSPGPNPNPYGEMITGVSLQVDYTGPSSNYYTLPQGPQLCGPCPIAPPENPSFSPPVAGLWVYFNVTSTSTNYTTLSHFGLTTSGANASLFELYGVVCCAPSYLENVEMVGFPGSVEYGLAFYAICSSVPNDGPTGYSLTLTATSP
jgi:hypothetical protein